MTKWLEFIEDSDGRGSAARLNMIVGVGIGSFVVIWLTIADKLGWEIFATFMGATGGIYGLGKWRESAVEMQQIKSDSPNQETVPVPVPNTVINVGADKTTKAKDVNVQASGDVNVSPKTRRKK